MGEVDVRGPDAGHFLQSITPNDVSRLADGQAQYSALTTSQGTFIDDILIYRFSAERFFLCVNATNTEKDYQWMLEHKTGNVQIANMSDDYAQLALQGPRALAVLQRLTPIELARIKNYWFTMDVVDGVECIVSRTGYTGEDGFELYVSPAQAESVWYKLLEVGTEEGLLATGLGARNTLRLEAKMALYGNDIDDTTTALEADLGWIVKFDKGDFLGRATLLKQKTEGLQRLLVGFEMVGKGIARDHYPVHVEGREVGHVTSGSPAPYLKKNIGLTYLPIAWAKPGTEFEVLIRNHAVKARVVPTPFYKRKR
jgi:aminomethyltransferase